MIVFTSFVTCKKDKTFGEKYPELVGEWEWEMGYYEEKCTIGIPGPGGHYDTYCPVYFYPGDRIYRITHHTTNIKKNGVIEIYSKGRLLEKGRMEYYSSSQYIYEHSLYPLNKYVRNSYLFIKKRNLFTNQYFNNNDMSLFDFNEKEIFITHYYYPLQNEERLLISATKIGHITGGDRRLTLIYYKK